MKNKGLKISIFMMLLSICACSLFLSDNSIKTYATSDTSVDCYYLAKEDNSAYRSNIVVGSVEGVGDFVVGKQNVELTASANSNYQLVGWQITYNEQDDRVEFYDTSALDENSKVVKLKAKDETDDGVDNPEEIEATISFVKTNGYYTSGTFNLKRVFEDIEINPVFDHIYFQTNINELVQISSHKNSVDVDGNKLFYETASEDGDITTYSNAYFKIGENYYYYGEVYSSDNEYYTLHKTCETTPTEQKVDYLRGSSRVGDIVEITLDVDIDSSNIKESKNIDLKSVSVVSNKTSELDVYEASLSSDYFHIEKDEFLRTKNYTINFIVLDSSNFVNTVQLSYHNLYVVNINLLVDGSDEHDEHSDILGKLNISLNEIVGNLSIYNFYSTVSVDELTFLAKTSAENNSRSFGVSSLETITCTTETGTYRYYTFSNINGQAKSTIYYSNINQNLEINVDYTSVVYGISFGFAELMIDGNLNPVLVEMNIESPETIELKRGTNLLTGASVPTQTLGEVDDFYFDTAAMKIYVKEDGGWVEHANYEDLKKIGYEFIGYATSLTSSVQTEYSYQVDKTEPKGTSVWLCLKKQAYSVVLSDYNQIVLGTNKPLNSVTVTKINAAGQSSETLTATGQTPTLVGTSTTLSTIRVSLGESLLIEQEVNNGFNVRYSLLSSAEIQALIDAGKTEEEIEQCYLTTFELDEDFIKNYVKESKVTIYVHEEKIEYSLTYYINVKTDDGGSSYVMADIDVAGYDDEQNNENFNIVKYDLQNVEISESNNNLSAVVSKIVVSGLYLNDTITLTSLGKSYGEDFYVFNWFIDGRSTLASYQDESNYNHDETIVKTREIQVVYSIPVAQVLISLDQEFIDNPDFTYSLVVNVDGSEVSPNDADSNLYAIDVGKVVTIQVDEIGYGYKFIGYQANGQSIVRLDSNIFEYTTELGSNSIVLKFERIIYQFYFAQYNAIVNDQELNGEYVDFYGLDYAELTVDNTELDITKPLGYYAKSLKIGEDVLDVETENNIDYRLYSNVPIYKFKLSRQDLIDIVTTYGVDNTSDGMLEVYITLEYEIYKYDIEILHTDSSGEPHGVDVQYLSVSLTYTHNGETNTVFYPYASDTAKFEEVVPYGANTEINILGQLQTGLRFVGWAHKNTTLVEFENATKYLKLGLVTSNKSFLYMFTYDTHKINLEYTSLQGAPQIEVNNSFADITNTTINLFDGLKISANAIRTNGYKFKSINYKKVVYNPYTYSEETWAEDYAGLYILDGHAYVKNTSETHDESKSYFSYEVVDEVYDESNDLIIDKFIINEYLVVDKTITFTIEYELLQLAITNKTEETEDGTITQEMVKSIIDFDINDIVVVTITATNKENETRDVGEADFVTFNDVVNLTIQINKAALEAISNKTYDLSLGIELKSVQVAGKLIDFTTADDKHFIEFSVSEFLPEVGEEIIVIYSVKVQQKNVRVTTAVTESTTFYENVYLFVDSKMPFGETVNSNKNSYLDKNWQFMAPLDHIYTVMSDDYANLFKTSGVKIYLTKYDATSGKYVLTGEEIKPESYEQYGISVIVNERNDQNAGVIEDYQVSIDKLSHNFQIVFQVQPIIIYNEGPRFEKVFLCNEDGSAVAQKLTIGSEKTCDIQLADEIKEVIEIKYQLLVNGVISGNKIDEVENVGEYKVTLSFGSSEAYDWFEDVLLAENISLTIKPRDILLTYDAKKVANNRVEKTYNKSSAYNVENIFKLLQITDGDKINIDYSSLLSTSSSNLKLDSMIDCYISSDGKGAETVKANEKIYYNLYVFNIALQNSEFNNNFNLLTQDLVISEYIKIKKLTIDLTGVSVYNKVYDKTNKAELSSPQSISVSKKLQGDDLVVNTDKMIARFEDFTVGTNKSVIIDASNALAGFDSGNYAVNNIRIRGLTIYPYSISTTIEGVGEIVLFNERGLTDKEYIDLIPLNATLSAKTIMPDTVEYADIHGKISQHIKGNTEFAIGYALTLTANGTKQAISNNLYISIPKVKNMTGAYYLSGGDSGMVNYTTKGNNIIIDLQDADSQIENIFLLKKKILLKPWQIVVIVLTSVAAVTAGVLTFVILRKRKYKTYSAHDKI